MGSQRGGASVTSTQSQQANEAFASYVPTEVPAFDFDSLLLADSADQSSTPVATPAAEPITPVETPTVETETDSS
jgi:hypothetical protein